MSRIRWKTTTIYTTGNLVDESNFFYKMLHGIMVTWNSTEALIISSNLSFIPCIVFLTEPQNLRGCLRMSGMMASPQNFEILKRKTWSRLNVFQIRVKMYILYLLISRRHFIQFVLRLTFFNNRQTSFQISISQNCRFGDFNVHNKGRLKSPHRHSLTNLLSELTFPTQIPATFFSHQTLIPALLRRSKHGLITVIRPIESEVLPTASFGIMALPTEMTCQSFSVFPWNLICFFTNPFWIFSQFSWLVPYKK